MLDTARPKYKENTTWLGMRGRDSLRKSTPKVNILQVFTIDFSEIQFNVNHNSQLDGQNKSAKSGLNLRKKTIHTNSDNGFLLWTKQAKMCLWSFDLITEPLSWWEIAYTTNQENQLKSPSIQVNNDAYHKDKKFSLNITCPALELTHIQDGNVGFHLQVPRGGTHPNGVGSELTKIFLLESLFCYSWFRLQLMAIHCNRREVWTQHPHTTYFLAQLHTFHLCSQAPHGSWSRSACLMKNIFIHMSPRVWSCVVSPCFDLFLSFECLFLLSILLISSILVIILHVVETRRVQNPCAHAEWGVLPRGDTKPSHNYQKLARDPVTFEVVENGWATGGRVDRLLIGGLSISKRLALVLCGTTESWSVQSQTLHLKRWWLQVYTSRRATRTAFCLNSACATSRNSTRVTLYALFAASFWTDRRITAATTLSLVCSWPLFSVRPLSSEFGTQPGKHDELSSNSDASNAAGIGRRSQETSMSFEMERLIGVPEAGAR